MNTQSSVPIEKLVNKMGLVNRTESVRLENKKLTTNEVNRPALQLTGYDEARALAHNLAFAAAARETPLYRRIIPATVDFYETGRYLFVHGWIPGRREAGGRFRYRADWREAAPEDWREARWTNGMNAAPFCLEKKTILCGHWHCSYGHAVYEHRGTEFGTDADFSPYYGPGIVALDACTAHSGRVNVVILREE